MIQTWIANHAVWYPPRSPEDIKREKKNAQTKARRKKAKRVPAPEPKPLAFPADIDPFREVREELQAKRERKLSAGKRGR